MSGGAWVSLVLLASAALASFTGACIAHGDRPPPADPDACWGWGCECDGYGPGVAHSCGRRAGEWAAESRTRGGRP